MVKYNPHPRLTRGACTDKEKTMGLKKLGMAMVAGALMLVLTAGVALALNQIDCGSISQDPLTPECYDTPQNDAIEGRDAPVTGEVSDIIYARGGDDQVDANNGDNEAYGGAGRDKIEVWGDDDKLYGGDDADFLTWTLAICERKG
jgi:hypothetical protein